MEFIVSMNQFGTPENKFRDADSGIRKFLNLAKLLQFLIETDFSDWDEVQISEIAEKEIVRVKI